MTPGVIVVKHYPFSRALCAYLPRMDAWCMVCHNNGGIASHRMIHSRYLVTAEESSRGDFVKSVVGCGALGLATAFSTPLSKPAAAAAQSLEELEADLIICKVGFVEKKRRSFLLPSPPRAACVCVCACVYGGCVISREVFGHEYRVIFSSPRQEKCQCRQ